MIRHVARRRRVVTPTPTHRPSLPEARRYCEAFARAHHENFPVASRFLPVRLRPHVLALYAFARTADDLTDEPALRGREEAELDRWEDLLHRCYHGRAEHPVFVALSDTAAKFELPITPLVDLLSGFRMDLRVHHYATWQDLMSYVDLAAKPVGRLLLYVFGYRDAEHHRFGEDLSTALALTGFWQDIGRDLERDRIYIPIEDLRHFGVTENELHSRRATPNLASLVRYECMRTRALYERARPLLDKIDRNLSVEMGLIWQGGTRALDRVAARANDPFTARAKLSVLDKARALARALTHR